MKPKKRKDFSQKMTKPLIGLGLLTSLVLAGFLVWTGKNAFTKARKPAVYQAQPAPEEIVVKIKGPVHRQIVFCQDSQTKSHNCQRSETISVTSGMTKSLDLTGHPLEFGDIIGDDVNQGYHQNGVVNVLDYSFIKLCRVLNASRGDDSYQGGCRYADGNLDGQVNNFDIDLIQKTLMEKTDDE